MSPAPSPPGDAGPRTGGRVVVVGSVNADLVVTVQRHPAPGETVLGDGGAVLPGGKGANQAVAAARLGARVALVGAVGSDPNAEAALVELRAAGVDLTAVAAVPGPTGLAVVTVAADGENTIVVVPGANAAVGPDVVARLPPLGPDTVLVLQGELPRATTEAVARAADAAGARVVLNLAPAVPLDPDVVRTAHPLVVNEHEAGAALRLLGGEEPPPDRDVVALASALATRLVAAGARSVVVTVGGAGAVVHPGGGAPGPAHLPAAAAEVVDTTGAGDAFVGATAAQLAAGVDLVAAAGTAVAVGTHAVRRRGAQPSYPTLGELRGS
ncbi:ribokinase [Geodermatophilus sp. DSM 44513]|uniref:ribokinase n=1 Tax=Geodermatophilus sp. DSM 44513 TaxID=1528104 RepID=UPI001412405F|nr:ribokinase [Geodermatophilus sp. DSM 44513]WNV73623.1 ribokinase [Geodermatophilus sp. DSM 44513]